MTILETVIAATLISVAIVASLSLSTNTQKETTYAKNVSLATKFNSAGLDSLKRLRSQMGWTAFVSEIITDGATPLYCFSNIPTTPLEFSTLVSSNLGACSAEVIPGTDFYRVVQLTVGSPPDFLDVVITTYFGDDQNRSVTTETRLTNY